MPSASPVRTPFQKDRFLKLFKEEQNLISGDREFHKKGEGEAHENALKAYLVICDVIAGTWG